MRSKGSQYGLASNTPYITEDEGCLDIDTREADFHNSGISAACYKERGKPTQIIRASDDYHCCGNSGIIEQSLPCHMAPKGDAHDQMLVDGCGIWRREDIGG